jgi:[acyl-carrier-protein] S-malonyltransferase
MQPAADVMQAALEKVTLTTPVVPLVANVLASEVTNPADIGRHLVEQVTAMVRWRESVQYMKAQGVDALVECGTGKVLSGLVKRIDREMTGLALNTPADIEAFLKTA